MAFHDNTCFRAVIARTKANLGGNQLQNTAGLDFEQSDLLHSILILNITCPAPRRTRGRPLLVVNMFRVRTNRTDIRIVRLGVSDPSWWLRSEHDRE